MYLRWAYRNLYKNKTRTLLLISFIALIATMLFMNFSFLRGSSEQARETLHNYTGDITITSMDHGNDFKLDSIVTIIENDVLIDRIIKSHTICGVQVISKSNFIDATVIGNSVEYYESLKNSVEWDKGSYDYDKKHICVLEKTLAEKLSINIGDFLTLKYKTDEGVINTASLTVNGIFIGNKYQHDFTVFTNIEEATNLALTKYNLSSLKIFMKSSKDDYLLQQIVDKLKIYNNKIAIKVPKWEDSTNNQFFTIFTYVNYFMIFLLSFISIIMIIILYFSIQNIFYMIFAERSNEISVLATYGMNHHLIFRVVFFEAVYYFTVGISLGLVLALYITTYLETVSVSKISSELIVVIGGSSLNFEFEFGTIILIAFFIFISGLTASFRSLKRYYKLEVRNMIGGI